MNQLISHSTDLRRIDNFCHRCGNGVSVDDNFCRRCGNECHQKSCLEDTTIANVCPPDQVSLAGSNDPVTHLMNNRLLVIGLIAMTGPLGLPALWFSRRFSRPTKIVTTVVYVIATTVVPLAIAWYWLEYSLRPLVDAFPKG